MVDSNETPKDTPQKQEAGATPSNDKVAPASSVTLPPKAYRGAYARSLVPLHNRWFVRQPKYTGSGVAHFTSPKGTVKGEGQVEFDKGGRAKAVLNYAQFECTEIPDLDHDALIMGRRSNHEGFSSDTVPNPIEKFELEDEYGKFETFGEVYTGGQRLMVSGKGDGKPTAIPMEFRYLQGIYKPKRETGSAKYWVLPLGNFIGHTRLVYDDLEEHPLRLRYRPKLPNWLSDDDAFHLKWNSMWQNSTIAFRYKGKVVFIELLKDYKRRKQQLLDRKMKSCITAVMVGEITDAPPDVGKEHQWEFVRLLSALRAVTGSEIYAPWLELRDESGALIERRHLRNIHPEFREGTPIIDEWYSGATGYFLTKVLESGVLANKPVRVLFEMIRAAREKGLSTEERLMLIFRMLDLLCQKYDTRSAWTPEDTLRAEHAAVIAEALSECRKKLAELARSTSGTYAEEEVRRIKLVSNRIADAKVLHSSYGGAILELFKQFGIDDFTLIEEHLKKFSPEGRVPKLFEKLRGGVVHGGFLSLDDDSPISFADVHALSEHLVNVCVRIMFSIVGYDGPYNPRYASTGEAKFKWPSGQRILEWFGYVERVDRIASVKAAKVKPSNGETMPSAAPNEETRPNASPPDGAGSV